MHLQMQATKPKAQKCSKNYLMLYTYIPVYNNMAHIQQVIIVFSITSSTQSLSYDNTVWSTCRLLHYWVWITSCIKYISLKCLYSN